MKRILTSIAVAFLTIGAYAQWSNPVDDVPAYHATPPAPGAVLPPILSGKQLTGPNFVHPWQKAIYRDAAKVSKVLYQLPCYCRCDRALGHTSLHSCFEGLHGAECSTCAKEGYYAYKMTMEGKTAKEIRDGIMHQDYLKIDLNSIGS
jgi:Protein of unknown function with PCYCGC motif